MKFKFIFQTVLVLLLVVGFESRADEFSAYSNATHPLSNDLFVVERPGVDDFNVLTFDMPHAIGALRTNDPLPSANLSGFVPSTLLSNVTATYVSTIGTNYGAFTRNFTNTLSTNLWVQMTNATATAVFNRLGTNVIPPAVNPTTFPLSAGMWLTNSAGGGYWYTP